MTNEERWEPSNADTAAAGKWWEVYTNGTRGLITGDCWSAFLGGCKSVKTRGWLCPDEAIQLRARIATLESQLAEATKPGVFNVPEGAWLFVADGEPRTVTEGDEWILNSLGEIYSLEAMGDAFDPLSIVQIVRRIDGPNTHDESSKGRRPAAAPQAEPQAGSGKPRYHVGGKGNRVVLAENGDHFAWCNFEYQANAIAQALNARDAQAAERPCEKCGHKADVYSAETGKLLFCAVCDTRDQLRDALQMEREYKAKCEAQAAELAKCREQHESICVRREELKAELAEAKREIERLKGNIDEWRKDESDHLTEIARLKAQLAASARALAKILEVAKWKRDFSSTPHQIESWCEVVKLAYEALREPTVADIQSLLNSRPAAPVAPAQQEKNDVAGNCNSTGCGNRGLSNLECQRLIDSLERSLEAESEQNRSLESARDAQAAELKQAKECEETFRKGFIESQTKRNAADQQAIWLRKEIESLQAQLAASARAVEALNFVEAEQISVWLCRGGESKPWSASKDTNLYGAGETPIDAILRLKALLTATGEGT
jgi:hypothetical protein